MTIAAVLTVAVSLSLVGAALLLRQGSANATGTLERGTKVTVWMEPNATSQQIDAVKTQLAQLTTSTALRVLEQGPEFLRGPPAALHRRLPGHDAGRDADLLLVHAVALPDAAQVVRTFNGTAGVLAVTDRAGDPQRGDGINISNGPSSRSPSC